MINNYISYYFCWIKLIFQVKKWRLNNKNDFGRRNRVKWWVDVGSGPRGFSHTSVTGGARAHLKLPPAGGTVRSATLAERQSRGKSPKQTVYGIFTTQRSKTQQVYWSKNKFGCILREKMVSLFLTLSVIRNVSLSIK